MNLHCLLNNRKILKIRIFMTEDFIKFTLTLIYVICLAYGWFTDCSDVFLCTTFTFIYEQAKNGRKVTVRDPQLPCYRY